MKVWIIGLPGVGKTFSCRWMVRRMPARQYRVLLPGQLFRSILGPEIIAQQVNPVAPALTEEAARKMVTTACNETTTNRQGLIVDGFPRRVDQVPFVPPEDSVVIYLTCDEDLRQKRMKVGRSGASYDLAIKASVGHVDRLGKVVAALNKAGVTVISLQNNMQKEIPEDERENIEQAVFSEGWARAVAGTLYG